MTATVFSLTLQPSRAPAVRSSASLGLSSGVHVSARFPGRKLSVLRLTLLSVVVGGLAVGGLTGFDRWEDARAAESAGAFFAGYVDVTATPSYEFEDPAVETGGSVVLSFIVASKTEPCTPSWGTFYGLDEAEAGLDLDRRVARLVQDGGEVIVSFGGLLNDELATACTDPDDLKDAYADVIDRYKLSTVDLDIEGENLKDTEAGQRRAEALAALQSERAGDGDPAQHLADPAGRPERADRRRDGRRRTVPR